MRFDTNRGLSSCGELPPSKTELTQRIERNKELHGRLKKDMKALSNMMSNGYIYEQHHLQELIGQCFISLSNTKVEIKNDIKKLRKLK